jgi:hypothetical protein
VDITKPDGNVPQIGDNDNGRFFKLSTSFKLLGSTGDALTEDHLDHAHLVDAIDGLLGLPPVTREGRGIDGSISHALARPPGPWVRTTSVQAEQIRIGELAALQAFDERLGRLGPTARQDLDIDLPGPDLSDGVQYLGYPEFGLYVAKSARLYVAIRCGPMGQRGNGGHDHNDQLSLELMVDGDALIRDPGTYLYSPSPDQRNRYRSVRAHFAPQLRDPEPASLMEGLFALGKGSHATCLFWDAGTFAGQLIYADGRVALCRIQVEHQAIRLVHGAEGGPLRGAPSATSDWRAHLPTIPYSPGYGLVER